MDSQPLVPQQVSPTKKILTFLFLGILAAYMAAVVIVSFVQGHKFHLKGTYFTAATLLILIVSIFLVNWTMPYDFMENKARYSIWFLNFALFLVATGVLVMSLQKTPCPVPKPCPPVNRCSLRSIPDDQWFQAPDCMEEDRAKVTYALLSTNFKCPPPPTPPPPSLNNEITFGC